MSLRPVTNNMQPWVFEHAIESGVSVQFAWNFWTNVRNWLLDADVVSIEIDGELWKNQLADYRSS